MASTGTALQYRTRVRGITKCLICALDPTICVLSHIGSDCYYVLWTHLYVFLVISEVVAISSSELFTVNAVCPIPIPILYNQNPHLTSSNTFILPCPAGKKSRSPSL